MMGHKWLDKKVYESVWGGGRHTMRSQVLNHRRDPTGFVVEPYADSDVVNKDTPMVRSGGTAAAIWGHPVPTVWH
ncbi:uncharacterized protein HMPREF1541_08581 [Cyphellophora europaea CBS 101466]|uniref:Uncharacterized protein n=1 Tax=Cyphellophora europaea (strain CBS 101466) TaxID=1220924 RepID=W2RKP3_CYPE1|nr:uncharacterized protein HMPREF1541_08581 [Cyphellophora europaea CBS 101466]ETN36304.1 hypothetical protein HMPREF1541_08581 [Cyphellophora europaea CBS 101466]